MKRKKVHKFKSEILEIKEVAPSVKVLRLSCPEDFSFYPGQFVSFVIKLGDREIQRSYSISSYGLVGSFELCIKILDKGFLTKYLDKFVVGDCLDVVGPLGGFLLKNKKDNFVFISTGVGIAPFRSMIDFLLSTGYGGKITLLVGYRKEDDLLYDNYFIKMDKENDNFYYKKIFSQPSLDGSSKGRVQELLKDEIGSDRMYYICGLNDMVSSVREMLLGNNVLSENIVVEKYD